MYCKLYIKTIITYVLCISLLTACKVFNEPNKSNEDEKFTSQEEFQMQMLEWLTNFWLLSNVECHEMDEPKEEIAPGIEIYSERLKLYIYCYGFYGGARSIITSIEDIRKLYEVYDEDLEKKLINLYSWWLTGEGEPLCDVYNDVINEVYKLYSNQYGLFNGKDTYEKMMTDDKIALEKYVRDNPDFMPKEVYYTELRRLHIIDQEEYKELRDAASEALNQTNKD